MNEVSDGYFATMGTPFIVGRDFNAADVPGSTPVVIVSETMAKKFFGSTNALGKHFRVQEGKEFGAPFEVVGVVRDTKYRSLKQTTPAIAYFALSQNKQPGMSINYEVRADQPMAVAPQVKAAIAEISPRFTLELRTLEQQIADSLTMPRLLATLSGFFGALALVLATIGLYGIMSYGVARRRNEIGVRIALGAAQHRVLRMILVEASVLVLLGLIIGTALAKVATRVVSTFLYSVTATDPTTLALSAATLAVVAITAATLPALRASRLDPVEALRGE
jgi:putative ABC transport system permease protein